MAHKCPKCGEPMELELADKSCGIVASFWFCVGCGVAILCEDGMRALTKSVLEDLVSDAGFSPWPGPSSVM